MGRYTLLTEAIVDEVLEGQLQQIVEAIRSTHPATEAVLLVGGFGRGEGSAVLQDGAVRALNDYDILVISPEGAGRESLQKLSPRLAESLGMDFVDIGLWSPESLEHLPPTIFNYDLKHGARVLFGDPCCLDRIPPFDSTQIPPWEGVQLLLNRMAGLLGGFRLRESPPGVEPREPQYFRNQVVKALLACSDALIAQAGEYRHRYVDRREIFRRWARGGKAVWLEPEVATRIDEAYGEKLEPGSAPWANDVALMVGSLPALEQVFLRCLSRYLNRGVSRVEEVAECYLRHHRVGRLASLLSRVKPCAGVVPRHVVYACLPLVLFSLPLLRADRSALAGQAQGLLRGRGNGDLQPDCSSGGSWETLRQMCVRLWERHCHG
ncbi:MAG TPA: nucleotidyltransferase domain-containing protein [Candidatus Methylomirabilis sp.]|nr:nucleotidyltransferase domain-containing protein [Candidatus Methylomirabilis sp.]